MQGDRQSQDISQQPNFGTPKPTDASEPVTGHGNPDLVDWVIQQIIARSHQRVTFAEYMDWALYHPQHGYYTTQPTTIGYQGDFVTSPHLAPDFSELLAEQLVDLWQTLDCPSPFTVVEMGAGQGLLARDALTYLQQQHSSCFAAIDYCIVEKSDALMAIQRQTLAPIEALGTQVRWCNWDDIPENSIVGCCLSNELVDAFPVHQITVQDGQLREVYVTVNAQASDLGTPALPQPATTTGAAAANQAGIATSPQTPQATTAPFAEVVGDCSTPQLESYFQTLGLAFPSDDYPEGYRSEVNLAALDWLERVATRLQRGYVLTIDYGYPATRYYSPARSQGTLQCYYRHGHHSDPYCYLGLQDLTAHVNFTALEKQGEQCGLQTVGFTQQGLFLMALGLGDRLAALSKPGNPLNLQALLQRREALHQLINPMGLGNFGVLIQGKGLAPKQHQLKGLQIPAFSADSHGHSRFHGNPSIREMS